jgi:hypothetical protein
MFTKTALTAAIILGTASVALASEADSNLLNRYPAASMTQSFAAPAFQGRNVSLGQDVRSESYIDRASQTSGGGY